LFEALVSGDAERIEAALRDPAVSSLTVNLSVALRDKEPASADWLDRALASVVAPLTLLGRGDLLARLHASSLRRLGAGSRSVVTATAAVGLAEAGDWDHALEILDQARREGSIEINPHQESLLWNYAYLHRRVETVLPLLAGMPFRGDAPHLLAERAWRHKAYRIRSGATGIVIPAIEGERPPGYLEAAAMQIAELAYDASAAAHVRNLRRALKPVEMVDERSGIITTYLPQPFATAEAQIAARRKDLVKARILAQVPSISIGSQVVLKEPRTTVIDAFLHEGDWRSAVDIAKAVPRGPGRDLEDEWIYSRLAVAAAWSGDDADAAALLTIAQVMGFAKLPQQDRDRADDSHLAIETMFAGVREGLLPRKYLHVLSPAFD
jgi:hypothetical protein